MKLIGKYKIDKDFIVVMMGLGIKESEYNSFKSTLADKIKRLDYSNEKIVLCVSAEVYQFQNKSIEQMKKMIDLEFFRVLSNSLPLLIIQPYDIEYFRDIFDGRYSIKDAVSVLVECGVITEESDTTTTLNTLERNWSLLIPFVDDPTTDYQNWGQITPSSKQLLVKFYSKLGEFTNADLLQLEGKDLVKDLIAFNRLCHTHHLEHVSFRSRALKLLTDEISFKELQRLASFRKVTFENLLQIWSPLKTRVVEAILIGNVYVPSGKVFEMINLKKVVGAIEEIERYSRTDHSDFEKLSSVLAPFLGGFSLADGVIAAYLWVTKLSMNTSTSSKIVVPVLTTTAVVFLCKIINDKSIVSDESKGWGN
jgi:hypothetical protein